MLETSALFIPGAAIPKNLHELPAATAVAIGPFSIRGIPVDHSAPDSRAILVEADGQRLLYSGDLRAHGRQRHLLDELPEAVGSIDVLILEGTTIGQPEGSHGFANELAVEHRLARLLTDESGLVVVIASGQYIDRAISVYRAALAAGRELVVDPYQAYVLRTLHDTYPDAPQFDSPAVRVKFIHSHVVTLKQAGCWDLVCGMARAAKVSTAQLAANPTGFVYIARSSRSTVALLRHLSKTARPCIVWSQWKGYLAREGAIQRFCAEFNIEPICIHSGGHASPGDLADLAARLDPRSVVPIHTEAASRFSAIIPRVRVVADGEAVSVASLIADSNGAKP